MQLDARDRTPALGRRLGAAACLLLASSVPAVARGDAGATTRIDAAALLYRERNRANVVEPTVRVTRLLSGGQSLSLRLGLDSITGASPTGSMPSGRIQTSTTPSGRVVTSAADQIPTTAFNDFRGALDGEWVKPLGRLVKATTGGHFSREKDYRSLGWNEKVTVDFMDRLATLTLGAGVNQDQVVPLGGAPVGLSEGSDLLDGASQDKRVTTALVGLSRILSRRWMMGITASRDVEHGYLTEPYKVVSMLDPATGVPSGELPEKRPADRRRTAVLASSAYHLSEDVCYASYRYYWDTWGVRSHTLDLKYRRELGDEDYLQPHLRLYAQTAADFFSFGLRDGTPLPEYATSDYRLGPLRTLTVGATYGFQLEDYPGEFFVRGEFIRQWGDGHPPDAVGVQRQLDLMPPLDIATVVVGYSREF